MSTDAELDTLINDTKREIDGRELYLKFLDEDIAKKSIELVEVMGEEYLNE